MARARPSLGPDLLAVARRWRRWIVALGALLYLGVAGSAAAQTKVVSKRVTFRQVGKNVTMSVGFREMFDAKLREKLKSGFATTVVMRVYLYQKGGGRPIVALARRLRAVYDLWDEQFRLTIEESGATRSELHRGIREVVDRLSSFWRVPLVRYTSLAVGKRYFVAAIVEVDPMSKRLLAAVRRWLRKPARRQVGGNNLFGSFVSIFVNNKIRSARKTYKFRSQPFFRRK